MEHRLRQSLFFFIILPCLLLLLLPRFFPILSTLLWAVTNLFSGERSYSKTVLVLCYILALTCIVLFKKYKTDSVSTRNFLIATYAVSFLLNLISFVWFFLKYHFAFTDFVITVNRGELSSTQFLHNHVLKGVIGIIAQFFHHGIYENLDPGTAFLGILPTSFYIFSGLVFIAAVISSFVYFWHRAGEHARQNVRQTILFIILYSLSTFILLKNILDGGLFDFATLPALITLALILFYKQTNNKKLYVFLTSLGSLYLLILLAYVLPHISTNYPLYLDYLYKMLVAAVIVFVPWFLLQQEKINTKTWLLLGLLLVSVMYPLENNLAILLYRSTPIGHDGAVVGMYTTSSETTFTKEGAVGNLNVYVIKPQATTTVGVIVDRYGLLDNFYPVAVPWETCLPFDNSVEYDFVITTPKPVALSSDAFVTVKESKFLNTGSELYRYQVSLTMNGCLPRPLTSIQEYFNEQGIKTFFISNATSGRYVYDPD